MNINSFHCCLWRLVLSLNIAITLKQFSLPSSSSTSSSREREEKCFIRNYVNFRSFLFFQKRKGNLKFPQSVTSTAYIHSPSKQSKLFERRFEVTCWENKISFLYQCSRVRRFSVQWLVNNFRKQREVVYKHFYYWDLENKSISLA